MIMSSLSESGADISNWRVPPFSRWAFRNLPDILPCAVIPAAPGQARELPEASCSLESFSIASGGGRTLDFDQFLEATVTDALVVMLDGYIVHEFYAPGMTADTRHILMSASKSIVGLIVGTLVRDGLLDMEAKVATVLPEAAGSAWADATLRQLIDMRTGVVLDPDSLAAYNSSTGWDPAVPGLPSDLRTFFETTKATTNPHDGPFRYTSANTDLLGWIIERATGQTFASLVSERLWKRMGAAADGFITVDRRGLARCTGGIGATARDFARIGQLVLDGGERDGQSIIPADWIDDIGHNGDRQAWAEGEFAGAFPARHMSYRGGWYVIEDDPRTLFAMGIHGQNLFVDRTNRLVIAKLSTHAAPIDNRAQALTHRAMPEIRRCLVG